MKNRFGATKRGLYKLLFWSLSRNVPLQEDFFFFWSLKRPISVKEGSPSFFDRCVQKVLRCHHLNFFKKQLNNQMAAVRLQVIASFQVI